MAQSPIKVDPVTREKIRDLAVSKNMPSAALVRVVFDQLHRQEFPERQGFGADLIKVNFAEGAK